MIDVKKMQQKLKLKKEIEQLNSFLNFKELLIDKLSQLRNKPRAELIDALLLCVDFKGLGIK